MLERVKNILRHEKVLFLLASGAFMIVIWYAVTRKNEYVYAIPFLLAGGWMALNNFRNIWYLAVLFLPLSFNFSGNLPGVNITFPTDLLALALLGLVILKMISERRTWTGLYNHSIFWVVAAWLFWMIFTTVASSMPLVSLKWLISMIWIIGAFYFMSVLAFEKPKVVIHFYWLIGAGFMLAMLIIMAKYVMQGRNPFTLRFNPTPVFNDHTVFGAFTTFFVPIFVLFTLRGNFSRSFRIGSFILLVFLLMGLFFSYSRGAWASTFLSLFLMGLFMVRHWIRRLIVPIIILLIAGAGITYNYIHQESLRNKAVSRESWDQHIRSITNFSTDHSNTERINRWSCSWEMFKDKPIFGFGPGTYMFQYGNYQLSKYRTPVSTNRGDNGTAHNEFLLALSEMGLLGGLLTLFLFIWPIFCGLRGYIQEERQNIKLVYLGVTFGLVAYTMHALVNNFLDQDKAGVAFFGALAVITALDLQRRRIHIQRRPEILTSKSDAE